MKIELKIAAALALVLVGVAGGWTVRDWKADADDKADFHAAVAAMNDAVKEQQKELEKLRAFNDNTAEQELATIKNIAQARASLENLKREIQSVNVGGARITADGDRLRTEAHRKATAPNASP